MVVVRIAGLRQNMLDLPFLIKLIQFKILIFTVGNNNEGSYKKINE